MSISIDSVSSNAVSSASSVAAPSITPSGENRLLFGLGGSNDGILPAALTMTYNSGTSMTSHWDISYQSYFRNSGAYTIAPGAVGTVVTATAGATQYSIGAAAVALSGVDQALPVRTSSNTNKGVGAQTISISTISAVEDLVLDLWWGNAAVISVNQGNTLRTSQTGFAGTNSLGVSSKAGGSDAVTMGWDLTDGPNSWGGMVAVSIMAVPVIRPRFVRFPKFIMRRR